MSVLDLVARETSRAGRLAAVLRVVVPVALAVSLLSLGAMLLARGRWLALPPVAPFVVWGLTIAVTLAGSSASSRSSNR